ncbi:hypothetical protein BHE74_00050226, partial [Ensete ventricosum]
RGCMLSPLPIQVVSWSKRLLHPSLCLVAANEITRKGKGIEEEKAVDYLPFTSSGRRRASGSRLEMETSQQSPDRIVIDNYLIFYQPPSAKDEKVMTSNATHDTNSMDVSADSQGHLDSSDAVSGYSTVYPPNFFAPQAHSFFFRGQFFPSLYSFMHPVNASAHFCGVAEMIGPVDFERSVDYWQQDKWSGQFPLKWHMVKDVPNNLFRHIILENNENKPVTNSRDTQEVSFSF